MTPDTEAALTEFCHRVTAGLEQLAEGMRVAHTRLALLEEHLTDIEFRLFAVESLCDQYLGDYRYGSGYATPEAVVQWYNAFHSSKPVTDITQIPRHLQGIQVYEPWPTKTGWPGNHVPTKDIWHEPNEPYFDL
mgnify:FL=1